MARLTDSSTQKFSVLIQLLDRRLLRPFYTHSHYGLSPLQINVLLLLSGNASPSMSQIATRLDISKPNVTPIIDRLIQDGYVARTANEKDRRIINITATEKGKKLISTIRSDMRKMLQERFSSHSEAEFDAFMGAIDTCIKFLETMDE